MIYFSVVPMVRETWINGKDAGMCLTTGSVFLVFLFDSSDARQNLQSASLGPLSCDYYLYKIQSVQSTPLGI